MALNLKSIFKRQEHGYDYHKSPQGKVWHFLAHDDSWLSFVADAILVLVLGKFVLLPVIGLLLGSSFPLVAVVSGSMDHNGDFDQWWNTHGEWYKQNTNITRAQFQEFPYENGFTKGDVFIVRGTKLEDAKVGDVIVYGVPGRSDPIIHRVVALEPNILVTKGDANQGQLEFEHEIRRSQLHGKAVARIPYIGWVKVAFIEIAGSLR